MILKTTLPGNAGQWSPVKHTGPFCDGSSDDCTISESKEKSKTLMTVTTEIYSL